MISQRAAVLKREGCYSAGGPPNPLARVPSAPGFLGRDPIGGAVFCEEARRFVQLSILTAFLRLQGL